MWQIEKYSQPNKTIYYGSRIIVEFSSPTPASWFNRGPWENGMLLWWSPSGAGEWVSGSKSQWISSTVQRGTESPNLQILFNSNRGFYDFLPVCSAHPRRRRVLWGASGRWSVYSISISFIALSLFRKGYIFFLWGICFLKIITGGCLSISLPNPSQVRISDNEQARQQRRRRNRKNNNVDVTSRQHWWRGIIPWMDMVAGGLVVVEEDGYCLQALKAAAVRRWWMEELGTFE